MKKLITTLLLFGMAVILGTAHAGSGAPQHAHGEAKSAGKAADHQGAVLDAHMLGTAMMPHGDAQHMKDMAAFRKSMAENFAALMGMMTGLIYDREDALTNGAKILAEHADQIAMLTPPKNPERIGEYRYYAFQLKQHSLHFLDERGKAHGTEVYGYHLGQVVSACVSCHTNFRPRQMAK